MHVRGSSIISYRRRILGESMVADKAFDRDVARHGQFVSAREQRIRELETRVTQHQRPAHGVEPRRGLPRPVVVLTLAAPGSLGYRVLPSLTDASKVLGLKDCSICEAIRQQRPAKGHVFRYLDQLARQGVVGGGMFFPRRLAVPLGERERARLGYRADPGQSQIPTVR